jgi:hypothetical protein
LGTFRIVLDLAHREAQMNTSIATIPPTLEASGKTPLFLSPTDATGNLVLYKE